MAVKAAESSYLDQLNLYLMNKNPNLKHLWWPAAHLPALKKSLSSWWNILNCSTNASLYSPGFLVILASMSSVATKSSGPAFLWSLFCIVCLISCWNLAQSQYTRRHSLQLVNAQPYLCMCNTLTGCTICTNYRSSINISSNRSSTKCNLKVMRDVSPVGNIPNSCQRNRCSKFRLEGWQTWMNLADDNYFLHNITKKKKTL